MTTSSTTSFESVFRAASAVDRSRSPNRNSTNNNVRNEVFRIGALAGDLCRVVLLRAPVDPPGRSPLSSSEDETRIFPPTLSDDLFWSKPSIGRNEIRKSMSTLLTSLFVASDAFGVDLKTCVMKKIELNGRKYPVDLCRGKSGKYTAYSSHTGITRTEGQSTIDTTSPPPTPERVSSSSSSASSSSSSSSSDEEEELDETETIEGITTMIRKFATDRNWCRYHTPRNIVLALLGEVGELAELFQWRGDDDPNSKGGLDGWTTEDVDKVGQELADVTIYLLRLADVCGYREIGRDVLSSLSSSRRMETI